MFSTIPLKPSLWEGLRYRKPTPLGKGFPTKPSAARPAYRTDSLPPASWSTHALPAPPSLMSLFLGFLQPLLQHPIPRRLRHRVTSLQDLASQVAQVLTPSPPRPPEMAHLLVFFQANMPPIVEAKMIARITQQIMIMIFFCSSRRGKKKRVRNDGTAERVSEEAGRDGPGVRKADVKGQGRWIWLPEPRMLRDTSPLREKSQSTASSEDRSALRLHHIRLTHSPQSHRYSQ